MYDLKLTLIQSDIRWHDVDANLKMFSEKISCITDSTDVILLPEMFSTGFTMEVEPLAEAMDGKTVTWMSEQAFRSGALLIGSVIIKENSNFFNRLIWMEPDGNYSTYDKRHLFRMANEHHYFSAGNKLLVKEWKGWKICPLVCYDLRFPVWSRNTANGNDMTFDLLIYVANWPEARSRAWDLLLGARAVENLCYCAGLNRVGIDGKNIAYNGHSSVFDAKGDQLFFSEKEEIATTIALEYEKLVQFRKKFPAFLDADRYQISNNT